MNYQTKEKVAQKPRRTESLLKYFFTTDNGQH